MNGSRDPDVGGAYSRLSPEHVERLRRLVDDEPNLLDGFRRQLLRQFDVQTAVERAGGRQENHARRSGRERAL